MLIKFEKQSEECVFVLDKHDDIIDHLHKRDGQWSNSYGKSFKRLFMAKLYTLIKRV